MKRLLTSLLLITLACSFGLAQSPTYGFTYDGQGQYFSRTSPSKMDLNGSELATNGGFESDYTGWDTSGTGGTGTYTAITDTAERTGTKALQLHVGTAGNAMADQLVTVVSGYKYTFEFWGRGDGAANSGPRYSVRDMTNSADIVVTTVSGSNGTTYAKTVSNWQAPAGCTSVRLRVQTGSGANTTCFIDDVSLTQAYDMVWVINAREGALGTNIQLFAAGNAAEDATVIGYSAIRLTTNKFRIGFYDGTVGPEVSSSSTFASQKWKTIAGTISRTGNQTLYVDGLSEGTGSIAAMGKIVLVNPTAIGARAAGAIPWNGQIGEVLFVRYSSLPTDIASWIAYSARQKKIPMPPLTGGGEIVGWWDWSSGGGYDKSGTGNHLTKTGVGGRIVVSAPNSEIQ